MRSLTIVLAAFLCWGCKPAVSAPVAATRPAAQVSGLFDLAHAPSIIFISDGSGSMFGTIVRVRAALRNAAAALEPSQTFDVVFTSEDTCEALAKQLVAPTPANLKALDRFLEFAGGHGGSSDPIPAVRFAFALKPAVIFLMTDGAYPNDAELLELIRTLNKDHHVQINTIALLDHDEMYEKFLKQVARENGGTYRFAADKDFKFPQQ